MNEKLIKILERYELDKPILMHDKLDIIWDKKEDNKSPTKKNTTSQEHQTDADQIINSMQIGEESPRINKVNEVEETNRGGTGGDLNQTFTTSKESTAAMQARQKKIDEDNVNQYAVKHKLGRQRMFRGIQNQRQIKAYENMLTYINLRKEPKVSQVQASLPAYLKPEEVEREFLDAISVILCSGYYLAEQDFIELIQLLDVRNAQEHTFGRAKLLQFFLTAAKEFQFDEKLVQKQLSEPWTEEFSRLLLATGYDSQYSLSIPPQTRNGPITVENFDQETAKNDHDIDDPNSL